MSKLYQYIFRYPFFNDRETDEREAIKRQRVPELLMRVPFVSHAYINMDNMRDPLYIEVDGTHEFVSKHHEEEIERHQKYNM